MGDQADWNIAVLSEVCPDEGDELQLDVYMSGPKSADEGGPGGGVCELWVQRLCFE